MSPTLLRELQSARWISRGQETGTHRRQRARDAVAGRPAFRRSGSAAQSAEGEATTLPEVTIVVDKPFARNVRMSMRPRRQAPRVLCGDDRQRGKARAERRLQGQRRFLEPQEIRIRDPKFAWKGVNTKRKALRSASRPKQSRRPGLDWPEPIQPLPVIHGTPGAVRHWQDSGSHGCSPPDELGCRRIGGDGPARRCRPVRGSGLLHLTSSAAETGRPSARRRDRNSPAKAP